MGHVHDERAVHLELVDLEPLEVAERGVPGAVVVDRDADTQAAQLPDDHVDPDRVGEDAGLGDLQDELGRGHAVALERGGHQLRQGEVGQLPGGDVDGHPHHVAVRGPPRELGEGTVQDEGREAGDHPRVLGEGDEHVGGDRAAPGVVPPDQSLDADDLAVPDPHLGLERDAQPVLFEGDPQVVEELQPVHGVDVELRDVGRGTAPLALGVVQRDVGVLHELRRGEAVGRRSRDAGAGPHQQPQVADEDGLVEGLQQRAGDRFGQGERPGDDDGELVAAEARHLAAVAHDGGQPVRHLAQQLVADGVAQGVVDVLEVVEVDEHEARAGRAVRGGVVQAPLEAPTQQLAVAQTGEGVVQRLLLPAHRLRGAQLQREHRHGEEGDELRAEGEAHRGERGDGDEDALRGQGEAEVGQRHPEERLTGPQRHRDGDERVVDQHEDGPGHEQGQDVAPRELLAGPGHPLAREEGEARPGGQEGQDVLTDVERGLAYSATAQAVVDERGRHQHDDRQRHTPDRENGQHEGDGQGDVVDVVAT